MARYAPVGPQPLIPPLPYVPPYQQGPATPVPLNPAGVVPLPRDIGELRSRLGYGLRGHPLESAPVGGGSYPESPSLPWDAPPRPAALPSSGASVAGGATGATLGHPLESAPVGDGTAPTPAPVPLPWDDQRWGPPLPGKELTPPLPTPRAEGADAAGVQPLEPRGGRISRFLDEHPNAGNIIMDAASSFTGATDTGRPFESIAIGMTSGLRATNERRAAEAAAESASEQTAWERAMEERRQARDDARVQSDIERNEALNLLTNAEIRDMIEGEDIEGLTHLGLTESQAQALIDDQRGFQRTVLNEIGVNYEDTGAGGIIFDLTGMNDEQRALYERRMTHETLRQVNDYRRINGQEPLTREQLLDITGRAGVPAGAAATGSSLVPPTGAPWGGAVPPSPGPAPSAGSGTLGDPYHVAIPPGIDPAEWVAGQDPPWVPGVTVFYDENGQPRIYGAPSVTGK